jgi:hypothetical protein
VTPEPEDDTHTDGTGDDGVAAASDASEVGAPGSTAAVAGDGADGQDAGQATPESVPVIESVVPDVHAEIVAEHITRLDPPIPGFTPDGPLHVRVLDKWTAAVKVDDEGNGSTQFGLDAEYVASITTGDATARLSFEPSHTLAITRINVAGATMKNGQVLVVVTPKKESAHNARRRR